METFRIVNPARAIRKEARHALKHHWGSAFWATFIAAIFGAFSGAVYGFHSILTQNIESDLEKVNNAIDYVLRMFKDLMTDLKIPLTPPSTLAITLGQFRAILEAISVAALCIASLSLLWFIIGGTVRVGLCRWRLDLLDGDDPKIDVIFSGFGEVFWRALAVRIIRALRVLLWSLLLIFPGIIAAYRYSMAEYILADNPNVSATEALRESARMMRGNKARLFRLRLSFWFWILLDIPFLGIGNIWLKPYIGQAEAVFYNETSGRASIHEAINEMDNVMENL